MGFRERLASKIACAGMISLAVIPAAGRPEQRTNRMIEAEIDKSKNLLKIRFARVVGPEEARSHAERIEALLLEVGPGFRILVDLTALESMDLECVPSLKQVMDDCRKRGVAKVVRVIPDPQKDIGLNILSVFHYGRRVKIVTCETMEEAEEALRG